MKNVFKGLYMSFGMFCTIPLPGFWDNKAAKYMMPWFPLVGAVIGLLWWLSAELLDFLGWHFWLPMPMLAGLLMLVPFLFAGFIHLDGFMDTCDAALSRRGIEDKLRILKDPGTGAFAVIMLAILFILLYGSALSALEYGVNFTPLIVVPIVSRSFSALSMLCITPMSPDGYAATFRPEVSAVHRVVTVFTTALAFALSWLIAGWPGLIVAAAVAIG
ncbi:MAG: adenosylcobinamide-GDP ribazoletransferase, partial [Oscillospiraceae bacterium]|nr:adenosylcobinamide-GDP ribazoletransferase [Oscillospiraceae bacterium]